MWKEEVKSDINHEGRVMERTAPGILTYADPAATKSGRVFCIGSRQHGIGYAIFVGFPCWQA